MLRPPTAPFLVAILALAGLALLQGCERKAERTSEVGVAGLSVAEAMGSERPEGFARAEEPRPFVFPEDHGPHPAYRTEWWYFTGHLESSADRRFGYQLTFFRSALAPPTAAVPAPVDRPSDWATDQLYLAHFAVTDVEGERFVSADRLARGAAGLAGARARPLRVWVEGWQATSEPGRTAEPNGLGPAAGLFPVRLQARHEGTSIDLVLETAKPVVLHGERGFSTKGTTAPGAPPNASYYYSFTRLPTRGTVTVAGAEYPVTGSSWLDREWSTSALTREQVGWDWFSLQLSDGRELMAFQLRHRDGSADPATSGTLVAPDGRARSLAPEELVIETTDATWRSPRSGARYPAGWRIAVPGAGIDLALTPLLADQELDVGFRYWEGAVAVEGTSGGEAVTGTGYAELTGYAEAGAPAGR